MRIKNFKKSLLHRHKQPEEQTDTLHPQQTVESVVDVIEFDNDESQTETFAVKIRGSIQTPELTDHAMVNIRINDVTDNEEKPFAARTALKQFRLENSNIFSFTSDIGKLPSKVVQLEDFTEIACINTDWPLLPRKGFRNIEFIISVMTNGNTHQAAFSTYTFEHYNQNFGYLDMIENAQRAKALAVMLAFAVASADDRITDAQIVMIEDWIKNNIPISAANANRNALDKAFKRTINLIKKGKKIDAQKVAFQISEISPLALRYDIMQFCIFIAAADSVITSQKLMMLNFISENLSLDNAAFLDMRDKVLPPHIYKIDNAHAVLGIAGNMDFDQQKSLLNQQYKKWNARVTSSNPDIREQANNILSVIADMRSALIQ